jgi:hypothetical protein
VPRSTRSLVVAGSLASVLSLLLLASAFAATACGTSGASGDVMGSAPDDKSTTSADADSSTTASDAPPPPPDHSDAGDAGDAFAPTSCAAPAGLGRGLTWVRANPMMISGLSVVMGSASGAAVSDYFDVFHATAVHLWQTGIPTEIGTWAAASHAGFRYVSWVDADGKSSANGQVLGGMAPLPGRIGYQIGDEPLDVPSLNQMAAGAAAVKAVDPVGLRNINLNDSNEADALRTQAAGLADFDVLSYDHYSWGTKACSGLMKVRTAAQAAGKPYWRYMKSFHYKSDSPEGAESDLRWDAFVGAVYGFTGYTWFVYSVDGASPDLAPLLFSAGGDYAATKTSQYSIAATVNRELAQLGRTLTRLRSVDVSYVPVVGLLTPSGVAAWAAGAGGDPYLSGVATADGHDLLVGHFVDDCGEPYVMVQNQAHSGGDFPNASSGSANVTLTFDFSTSTDATLDATAISALDLTTGKATPRALTPTGAKTAKITANVAAGDVLFFKYANGRPFSLTP